MFPGSFQKLAECLQGRIQCGAGEEEFQAGIKESAHCTMEAGIGGGGQTGASWAIWQSSLGHGGPGTFPATQSHPTPLLKREPQWVTTRKSFSLAGEKEM